MDKRYFTNKNNNIIYNRLEKELNINQLPILGIKAMYGVGDICLEEDGDVFKFYILDRAAKFEYEEFYDIEDAIQKLIFYYRLYEIVDDSEKMKEIFYQSLNIEKKDIFKEAMFDTVNFFEKHEETRILNNNEIKHLKILSDILIKYNVGYKVLAGVGSGYECLFKTSDSLWIIWKSDDRRSFSEPEKYIHVNDACTSIIIRNVQSKDVMFALCDYNLSKQNIISDDSLITFANQMSYVYTPNKIRKKKDS